MKARKSHKKLSLGGANEQRIYQRSARSVEALYGEKIHQKGTDKLWDWVCGLWVH
jgi:hypothetical protein